MQATVEYPLVGGFNPSDKYEFVSWDDEIPNWMETHKIPWFQATNQYIYIGIMWGLPPYNHGSTI